MVKLLVHEFASCEPVEMSVRSLLSDEPPSADPHARWCGRGLV